MRLARRSFTTCVSSAFFDRQRGCNLSRSTWHPPSAERTNHKATPQNGPLFASSWPSLTMILRGKVRAAAARAKSESFFVAPMMTVATA
jgi:hypothetical protein